jgi:hypothetical protein
MRACDLDLIACLVILYNPMFQVPAPVETMDLLSLPPDRIGHGTCLHPEAGGCQEFVDTVLTHQTPLGILVILILYSNRI